MDTYRMLVRPRYQFETRTKMMVTLVLVVLQPCRPVLLPQLEACQLHSSGFDDTALTVTSPQGTFITLRVDSTSTPNDDSAPTVTISQGTFIGKRVASSGTPQTAIEAFFGIPYAEPPIGAQRYSPASNVSTSSSTFNATKYGHLCIQDFLVPDEDEDCLTLNVFRPPGAAQGKQWPVVVYIHGGSFVTGSGASRDVGRMVAASPVPLLGVSMNYRLGALGFLSSGVLARAGALNLGLQDQQHALRWVQANMEAFGGDPTKITIMGDSAGAHSVGHHLQNTASAGLFHQAIMESGAATARLCQPYESSPNPEQFQDFMNKVGINSSQPDDVVLSSLRALPLSTIKTASSEVFFSYRASTRWAFQPVIDGPGGVIPSAPIDLWTTGEWNKIPILTGFCNDEGAPFVRPIKTSQQFTDFFSTLNPLWSPSAIERIDSLYSDPLKDPHSQYPSEYRRIIAAFGQFAYIAPVRDTAHFVAPSGLPVYFYNFKLNSSVVRGTGHACAGDYVAYNSDVVNFSPSQKRLAKAVNAFWTSFIAYGDPNVAGSSDVVAWPLYVEEVESPNKIVFGAGNDERAGGTNVGILFQATVDTEFLTQTRFWWSLTAESER